MPHFITTHSINNPNYIKMQQNKNQQLDAKFRKFIKVLIMASIDEEQPDYYGNYELSDVYGGKKRQRFNFKYKYRFKGESKWEIVDIRSLRSVTLDLINE